jgi:hypothetical protein
MICNTAGDHKVLKRPAFVDACVAITKQPIESGEANVLGKTVSHMPITAVEAVSLETPEGLQMADVLATCGVA